MILREHRKVLLNGISHFKATFRGANLAVPMGAVGSLDGTGVNTSLLLMSEGHPSTQLTAQH